MIVRVPVDSKAIETTVGDHLYKFDDAVNYFPTCRPHQLFSPTCRSSYVVRLCDRKRRTDSNPDEQSADDSSRYSVSISGGRHAHHHIFIRLFQREIIQNGSRIIYRRKYVRVLGI